MSTALAYRRPDGWTVSVEACGSSSAVYRLKDQNGFEFDNFTAAFGFNATWAWDQFAKRGSLPPQTPFTFDEAESAWRLWRFNCGPSAIAALLGMTPADIRPHMLDFEHKGYTNPTLMYQVLGRLGLRFEQVYRSDDPAGRIPPTVTRLRVPFRGLMRIQWGGRWTQQDIPPQVRYRHTHWCAIHGKWAFDCNAVGIDEFQGWVPLDLYQNEFLPWLASEIDTKRDGKADGTWWPTHILQIVENVHGDGIGDADTPLRGMPALAGRSVRQEDGTG